MDMDVTLPAHVLIAQLPGANLVVADFPDGGK